MKRALFPLAAAVLVSAALSAPAFAGGIGLSGSYGPQAAATQGGKTRAEVRAELVAAYRDGTLPTLNKTSYPNRGLIGSTQAERLALQAGDRSVRMARD